MDLSWVLYLYCTLSDILWIILSNTWKKILKRDHDNLLEEAPKCASAIPDIAGMTSAVQSLGKCDKYYVSEKIISNVLLIFMKCLSSAVWRPQEEVQQRDNVKEKYLQ